MSLPAMEVLPGQTGEVPPEPEGPARKKIAGRSPTRIAIDRLRKDKIAVICFTIVLLFAVIAIFADQINSLFGVTTDTVRATDFVNPATSLPLTGPPNEGFDPSHPFGVAPGTGTDNLAVWTKGCQTSLFLATMAATLSTAIGVLLGLLAGFLGGIFDSLISFTIDLFLTFPFLVGALALAPIINDRFATEPETLATVSFWALVAILTLFGWMLVARLVRGEVLSLRERDFVKAARVIGVPTRRILLREMLPNLIAPIIISFSLGLPAYVSAEAGLSFLGIGIIGRESWGRTIEQATNWWQVYPQYLMAPVIGIAVLVVALNLLGDAIRDAFDPKTRR